MTKSIVDNAARTPAKPLMLSFGEDGRKIAATHITPTIQRAIVHVIINPIQKAFISAHSPHTLFCFCRFP